MQINHGPKRVEIHQNKDKLEMLCQFGKLKRCSRSRMFYGLFGKNQVIFLLTCSLPIW